ncbi:AMP-binding protein [Haliscomenobacter sp.]|uniref:AMP-binding protein n=1 Tax=Haliscomenobacter sp. TaxID=2717303 RepID=UPI00359351D7
MDIKTYFKTIREAITNEQIQDLQALDLDQPEAFNWVMDVFCPLNMEPYPDAEALIWRHNEKEKRYTFKSIYATSNQFLNFLRKQGVQQGNCIYTQLPLDPANWIGTLAAIKGGLILIPAANNLIEKDIAYRFQTIFPEVVITDLANAGKIEATENILGREVKVKIVVDGRRAGWHSIEVIAQEAEDADAALTRPDDHLFYFFTSGTTGLPKIVIHTHFTYPFGHLSTAAWVGMRHGDIHYNISAPGWAKFAWSSFFAPWSMGATIFANQVDKFDAKEQLKTIEKYQVTTFCAPPTVLRMMILEDFSGYQFQFRQCVAAGEPLNAEIIEKWQKGTGILIRDGYGQTETTCLVANMPGSVVKYGSMGKATFLYDIVVADEEGVEQPIFEEGSICIRMNGGRKNGVFLEYLGEPERKAKVFQHGLYYTGDKAYKDDEGYIWFVGRDDDVIKASDFRIGPFEVESVLIEHDAVVETAVVASPHELRGFAVKAFVLLRPELLGDQALAEALFAHCEQNLAGYKIPRIIEFVEALPKTISGKIRRVELRANEAQSKSRGEVKANEFFHLKY